MTEQKFVILSRRDKEKILKDLLGRVVLYAGLGVYGGIGII